ncbi:hypothetical protein I4U23_010519 [Adineta vaga]|nr:hypothetical protein I4U23_010519 [Adineta vaga]
MFNRFIYTHVNLKDLFIIRKEITCFSSSLFPSRSDVDPGQQMKILNQKKQFKQAIDLFNREKQKNTKQLSSLTIQQALKACIQLRDVQRGQDIHHLIQNRLKTDSSLVKSLIHFYMQCHDVKSAEALYNMSTEKTLYIYGTMMKGYIENQMSEKAIDLFKHANNPDEVLITLLFNACAQLPSEQSLNLVKNIWKKYHTTSLLNNHALTSLTDALMKCGDVKNAEVVFDKSPNKILPMYGAMIKGYIKNQMPEKAIDLFKHVNNPDAVLITLLFNACAQLPSEQSLILVKNIWKQYQSTYLRNNHVLTSLIDALMKCGDVKNAEVVFNKSPNKVSPMYGAMMTGYIKNQMSEKAIDLFKQVNNPSEVMIILLFKACAQLPSEQSLNLVKNIWKKYQSTSLLNNHALTSLINALMKCGDVKNAEVVFNKSPNKVSPMYGAMMKGYLVNEMPSNTLHLYHQIKNNKSTQSNVIIYLLAINALSQVAIASECQSIVDEIPQHIFSNDKISNALIDMWGKVGCVEKAEQVFNRLSSIDRIGYTSMINTYGINGMGLKAVKLFDQVPQSLIGDSTYVSVLNACSHSGLVDKARSIFTNIEMKTEKNYITMIDCLSRGSFFDEAQQLIDQYEQNHSPSPVMYMSLLSGARNQKNKDLAEKIYQNMKKLFPQLSNLLTPAAILLANVYASSGELEKAFSVRNQLSKSGAKKKPGLSWTAVNGEIYRFHAHDRSHPRSSDIHLESEKISQELILHGHEYDSTWITRPLGEDETIESVLCGHSERLAIAWNFVVNPNAKIIQITKNLRICGDCHQATKLIAAIRQCEIVIRDANRIHHFDKNGRCSCNDYF